MREIFTRGGIVMYPLLLCSITALAVILERSVFFIRLRCAQNGLGDRMRAFHRLVSAGEVDRARVLLKERDEPVMRALTIGLGAGTRGAIYRDMDTAVSDERRRLFSGLSILDTIVTASPLLGLLGTVVGILRTFSLLGGDRAIGDMQTIGRGISEALLTTAAGLVIAIPALVAMNYFAQQAEGTTAILEQEAASLKILLAGRGGNNGKALGAES